MSLGVVFVLTAVKVDLGEFRMNSGVINNITALKVESALSSRAGMINQLIRSHFTISNEYIIELIFILCTSNTQAK